MVKMACWLIFLMTKRSLVAPWRSCVTPKRTATSGNEAATIIAERYALRVTIPKLVTLFKNVTGKE